MATITIKHATLTGAAANPAVLVDGPKWDATHTVTGLENVDNTSDVNKPVSTAQAAADAVVAANAANASNLTSGTVPAGRLYASGKKVFGFFTGQSFLTQTPALAYTPAPNLFVWNWDGTDGHLGTAFVAPSATTINMSVKMMSDMAYANPTSTFYLYNKSITGLAISHWLSGTGAPDMLANIQLDIAAALTAAGCTQADFGVWAQGQGDTLSINQSYVANHATWMGRLWADTTPGHVWFPKETPLIICSIQSVADSNSLNADADNMNVVLNAVANADPDKRRYVYLSSLSGSTYWDLTAHPTAQGHLAMGALLAAEFLNGSGRSNLQGITVSPSTGNVTIGNPAYSTTPYLINLNTSYAPTVGISGTARQVVGADGVAVLDFLDVFGNLSEYIGRRANGTQAAKTTLVTDDIITGLGAVGYDGSNYSTGARASILFQAAETWTGSHRGTYAGLYLTPAGTDTIGLYYKFAPGSLTATGTTSGTYQIVFPAVAGTSVLKLPAGSTDFTATGGTSQVVKQTSVGGAFTVAQLGFSDLSGSVAATQMPALTGEATTSAGAVAVTLTNSAVIGKVLTGLSASAGTIAATDTLLQAFNKVAGLVDNAAWTAYTPTITSGTGTITTSSATGRYKQIGKTVRLQITITITTAGTGAGQLIATLPVTSNASIRQAGAGVESTVGNPCYGQILTSDSTHIYMAEAGGGTTIANGNVVTIGIVYEAA